MTRLCAARQTSWRGSSSRPATNSRPRAWTRRQPFLVSCRTVDGFFADMLQQLGRAIMLVEASINARLIIKAAEERQRLAEAAEHAKAADLARTHGAYGGMATLTTRVAFEVTDRRSACAFLWRHFDDEAIQKAIRSRIRDGGDEFKIMVGKVDAHHESGVKYFMEERALVR